MTLQILLQDAESPVSTGDRPFPKGVFRGVIVKPEDYGRERFRPTQDFMHDGSEGDKKPRVGGEAGSGKIYSLWLGEATSLVAGQDEPGDQKFFQDFIVEDSGHSIMDIDPYNPPEEVGWYILRDAKLLGNLALALGATVPITKNGKPGLELASNFLDMLADGTFDEQSVRFNVRHRSWTSKAGNPGIAAEITRFTADE